MKSDRIGLCRYIEQNIHWIMSVAFQLLAGHILKALSFITPSNLEKHKTCRK